jgi:hypothetical protein
MATTGLEVRLTEGRERAEVGRFTRTLDEIVLSLREIDRAYLRRGTRATWVLADLDHDQNELVVRLEARPSTRNRTVEDMLKPVDAFVDGAALLSEVPEVPEYFTSSTVTRLASLAAPRDGVQHVSVAPYNGSRTRSVALSDSVQKNATEAVRAYEIAYGSVAGVIDLLDSGRRRGGNLRLNIYDIQNRQAVQGSIPASYAEDLRQLWRHRVLVGGIIKRNSRGQAIRIDVDRILSLPESDETRPSTEQLLGIDPDWLGGRSVDDYIREVRGDT